MDDEIEKTIEEAHAYHRKHKTQPSHPLEEYTGDFFHPGYGSLKIELADEELHAKYNTLTFKLLHYKYDIFEAVNVRDEDIPMKVSFHTDKEGNITGIAVPFEPMVSDILFSRIAAGKMR